MNRHDSPRTTRAQSFVELLVGLIVLIPVCLFLLDMGVLVLANNINGDLAKTTARAAASATSAAAAQSSAGAAVKSFAASNIIQAPTLSYLNWQPPAGLTPPVSAAVSGNAPAGAPAPLPGQVMVATTVTVTLPVPFPMLPSSQTFSSYSIQPIVGVGLSSTSM